MQTTILTVFSVWKSDMDGRLADAITEFTKKVEENNGTITSITPTGTKKVFGGYEQTIMVLHTANGLKASYLVTQTSNMFTGTKVNFS